MKFANKLEKSSLCTLVQDLMQRNSAQGYLIVTRPSYPPATPFTSFQSDLDKGLSKLQGFLRIDFFIYYDSVIMRIWENNIVET